MLQSSNGMSMIAHSLIATRRMIVRLVEDLPLADYLHRAAPGANCAAWLLGHLVLVDRQALRTALGVTALPELPAGFEDRFSSLPGRPEARQFGDLSLLLPQFVVHRDLLILELGQLSEKELDVPMETSHEFFKTLREMLNFVGLHTALHAGQMSTIRRSLGRPPIM